MAKDNHIQFGIGEFADEPVINRSTRRSSRYTRASDHGQDLPEEEGRSYERAGRRCDRRFQCPSGFGQEARSPEAKARRVATNARRRQEALAWERDNPGFHDPKVFRLEILPRLQQVTLPQMMKATGLTSDYCWRIRRGERVPHPMYWKALQQLVEEAIQRRRT